MKAAGTLIVLFAMSSIVFGEPKEAPPASPPPKPFHLPPTTDFTLPNGMRVTIVPYGIVPKVAIRAFVDAGAIDEPSTVKRSYSGVIRMTGWRASQMPIPATSAGSNSSRISKFSRPTVEDMKSRAHRLRAKVRHCCKDGWCAGDAVNISVSTTLPGVDGWMPGTSVIALTAIAASPTASQSQGLRSTKPSAC